MDVLIDSFFTALRLIFTGDSEVFSITGRTLLISGTSTLVVLITTRSAEEMDLHEEKAVCASFKATGVHIMRG